MRIYISGLQVVAMTIKNLQFTPNNSKFNKTKINPANIIKQKSLHLHDSFF